MDSTKTKLEFVNSVLATVSEKAVTTLSDSQKYVAKAVRFVDSACNEVSTRYTWSWLFKYANASSWSGDTATIDDLRILHFIRTQIDGSNYAARSVKKVDFLDIYPSRAFVVDTEYVTNYTLWTDKQVRVTPYPDTVDRRANVFFAYTKVYTPPSGDGDLFLMPERYLELVFYKSCYHMTLTHAHDSNEAMFYQSQYETLLRDLLGQERNLHPTSMSFFPTNKLY